MQPKRLGDVMSTAVKVVPPEMSLREVAALFSEARISGAPVVAGGRVLGVVSATELLEFAAEPHGGDSAPHAVEISAWPGSEEPPAEFFRRYWADRTVDVYEEVSRAAGQADPLLNGFTAADIMSRRIHALSRDTPLAAAADYMLRLEIHRILVIEDGRLVGVVTTADMVRAMTGADAGS